MAQQNYPGKHAGTVNFQKPAETWMDNTKLKRFLRSIQYSDNFRTQDWANKELWHTGMARQYEGRNRTKQKEHQTNYLQYQWNFKDSPIERVRENPKSFSRKQPV